MRVEIRIILGDILNETGEAVAFPADPDFTFSKENLQNVYKIRMKQLFNHFELFPDKKVVKFDGLKVANFQKVYFCTIPTYLGRKRLVSKARRKLSTTASSLTICSRT